METAAVSDLLIQMQIFFILLFFSLLFLGLVWFGWRYFVVWYRNRDREKYSLSFSLLQIAVTRNNEIKIDAAEQFFASLASLRKGGRFYQFKPQEHFSFEIVATAGDIRFYIAVPTKLRDLFEKQIHGAYPGADIREVDEYNIFTERGKVAHAGFKLKSEDFYPIKVFRDLPTDPLSSITSALAKMGEGEGAVIQILISPADGLWKKKGRAFISETKKREANPENAKFNVDSKTLELIENKCSKPGFDTTIRVVVSSPSKEQADMHLNNISTAFAQFSSEQNGFTKSKYYFKSGFMLDFIYRFFPMFAYPKKQTSVLTSEELATIYHFPNKTIETPHIFWLNAKRAPAPANMPNSGLYFGKSTFRGVSKAIYLSRDDRRRHTYIIGKTGVGKSQL